MIFETPSALAHAVKYFDARCVARSYLAHVGEIEFHDAVDELQAAAVSTGLVGVTSQDDVQFLLAQYFKNVLTNEPEPPQNGQPMQPDEPILPDYAREIFVEEHRKPHATNGKAGKHRDKPQAKSFNSQELNVMHFEPIKYVVPGYVVEGLTLFAGKPKVGKSWLLLHAAIAVARGGFTLGDIHCPQGDVLYCALEDNQRRLQSRMTKLAGLTEWPEQLHFMCEMPRLAEGGLDLIKGWIADIGHPRLVIIDTLAMVRMPNRKDHSPYDADYAAVVALRDLAHAHGLAVVLVHHLRKADADDAFDTISGTLGLTGAPDTIMVLKRDANNTSLHAKGRDLIEIEKALEFNPDACTWTILGDAEAVKRSAAQKSILNALEEAADPVTPTQIAAECGMKAPTVRKTLERMLKAGEVTKAKFGQYTLKK
jgi:hypothetical protein